jgi:hypothetical protein
MQAEGAIESKRSIVTEFENIYAKPKHVFRLRGHQVSVTAIRIDCSIIMIEQYGILSREREH